MSVSLAVGDMGADALFLNKKKYPEYSTTAKIGPLVNRRYTGRRKGQILASFELFIMRGQGELWSSTILEDLSAPGNTYLPHDS
jgi:hypothetical protein